MADGAMADGTAGSQGVVKSWNGMKGYGFIACDEYAGDIMFSRNELPDDAREVQGKFLEGKLVYFEAVEGGDGRAKAATVQLLALEGQGITGKIKSFSTKNGYGFISSSALPQDVRFQGTDLSSMPPGGNLMGQLVTFTTQARPDGKLLAKQLMFQQSPGKAGMNMGFGKGGGKGQAFGGGKGGGKMSGGMQSGIVKSYSTKNGYGFIMIPGQEGDIKFGASDFDGEMIEQGTNVSFMAALLPDGRVQAKNVQAVQGAKRKGEQGGPIMPLKRPNMGGGAPFGGGKGGQWVDGSVKSYNAAKGFGFISCPGQSSDIYFASSSISPPQAVQAIAPGQGVSCELNYAPDGKLRAKSVSIS